MLNAGSTVFIDQMSDNGVGFLWEFRRKARTLELVFA